MASYTYTLPSCRIYWSVYQSVPIASVLRVDEDQDAFQQVIKESQPVRQSSSDGTGNEIHIIIRINSK